MKKKAAKIVLVVVFGVIFSAFIVISGIRNEDKTERYVSFEEMAQEASENNYYILEGTVIDHGEDFILIEFFYKELFLVDSEEEKLIDKVTAKVDTSMMDDYISLWTKSHIRNRMGVKIFFSNIPELVSGIYRIDSLKYLIPNWYWY